MTDPIVFVGAGVAAVSAAESLRDRGHTAPIVMMSAERHLPYDRPPLSKEILLGGGDRGAPLRPPDFYESLDIELRLGTRVISLDPAIASVTDDRGRVTRAAGVVLATGGVPRSLPVPGHDLDGVCVLRTLDHARDLRDRMGPGVRMVVVGAGFIGTEVAAAGVQRGADVVLLEALPAPLQQVLPGLATAVVEHHRSRGSRLRCGMRVESFVGKDRVTGVRLADGELVPADLVVVGVGMRPCDDLASAAGLQAGDGVHVDAQGRTSQEGVYAIGDVASVGHGTRRQRLEHWQSAVRSGRSVAAALMGHPPDRHFVPWFWSDQFDLNIQLAGLPAADDLRVVRGDPASGRATVLFHRDGLLTGVATLNNGRDVRPVTDLIAAGVPVPTELLAAPETNLRKLARAVLDGMPRDVRSA